MSDRVSAKGLRGMVRAKGPWLSALGLGFVALNASAVAAAEAGHAGKQLGRGALARIALELPETEVSVALRGKLIDQRLVFWSCAPRESLRECSGSPPEAAEQRLELSLPDSVSSQKAKVEVLPSGRGQALHIVLEGGEKPYHLLVAPAALSSGQAHGRPSLALRGSLGEQHEIAQLPSGELGLVTRRRACGRAQDPLVLTDVQELDLARGEFVPSSARLPLVQKKSAEPWKTERVEPTTERLSLALSPSLGSTDRARGSFGYGLGEETSSPQVFSFLAPRSQGRLLLMLARGSGALLLSVDGDLRPVSVPPLSADEGVASFEVELEGLNMEKCLTLYAEPQVTVRAVSWTVPEKRALPAPQLVAGLGGPDSANYELSLLADAKAASRALSEGYPRLTPSAKKRAFRVILNLPGALELPPLLVVLVSEDELSAQAEVRLHELEPTLVRSELERAVRESSAGDEARILGAFLKYDVRAALPVVLKKIDRDLGPSQKNAKVRRVRRSALRALMTGALSSNAVRSSQQKTGQLVEELLRSSEYHVWSKLELLRSVPLDLSTPPLNTEFARFASQSFRGAYLLLPQLLSRYSKLDAQAQGALTSSLTESLTERTKARGATAWSGPELAAYQTRLLELLGELELPEATLKRFSSGVRALATSSERRVREQAIVLLGARANLYALSDAERERLFDIVDEDAFPEVRSEAALTIGRHLQNTAPELQADGEAQLERRIKRQKELRVQRALTSALGASGGPKAREVLSELLSSRKVAYGVRAEAASALGQLCEVSALEELTRLALTLGARPTDEGQVELGLAAVRAVYRLSPQDAKSRLAPLGAPSVPGPIAGQVELILESGARSCAR